MNDTASMEGTRLDAVKAQLDLNQEVSERLLGILADSTKLVSELKPEWCRLHLDGSHLRLFCGRLIVMTLTSRRQHLWFAAEPNSEGIRLSEFESWRPDTVDQRPGDAISPAYPAYVTPPSQNGFYLPAADPDESDWRTLRALHAAYLRQVAVSGRAPDSRTRHDAELAAEIIALATPETPDQQLERQVLAAMNSDPESRQRRLREAPRKPSVRTVEVQVFDRNPDVIVEVLQRAAGSCERCMANAPFQRRSNGTPYLEVHHTIRLADGGEDTIDNALALCPNCHRKEHYG
jgi:5-methylcytosine-specific restriction endonuclease McrA